MNRVQVDASMDGLPAGTMRDPAPSPRDTSVDAGPTTENGLLSTQPHTLDDRLISAQFAHPGAAEAARDALRAAGIPDAAIELIPHAAHSARVQGDTHPADDTLLGRIREAILPDDASAGARTAVAEDAAVLNVRPEPNQVERVVRIIEASHPTRFDADLERWRNKGASSQPR